MSIDSGMTYPPTMPLYADRIRHARVNEALWGNPIPFLPFCALSTFVFLVGLGAIYAVQHGWHLASLTPEATFWIAALLPAVVLVLVILLSPKSSSPVFAYQLELFRTPDDTRMRWNLAVVSTANIYNGSVAQSEWLSLLPSLSEKDRFRALDFIRLVGRRLQRFPFCTSGDLTAMLIAAVVVCGVSMGALHYPVVEAIIHCIEMMAILQLFLLYIFVQRWQHRRRLNEVEEIFEELLPMTRPPADDAPQDEVDEWFAEKAKPEKPKKPDPVKPDAPQLPRAPWE
jgi:hypothetical protein